MFKKKSIVGIVLVGIMALGVGVGSMSLADTSDEDTLNNQNDIVIEDQQTDDVFVGGTPGSCGYLWDEERNGWHRPWDPDSFIPAAEKPDWDEFISEVPVVIVDPEPLDDQIIGGIGGLSNMPVGVQLPGIRTNCGLAGVAGVVIRKRGSAAAVGDYFIFLNHALNLTELISIDNHQCIVGNMHLAGSNW